MQKRHLLAAAAVAILSAATGLYVGTSRPPPPTRPDAAGPEAGVAALYAHALADAAGTTVALSQWKGKTLLVNFWATWCAPCVQEMPELSALATENAGKNVQIIGIGIDSGANIARFAADYKIAYPLYVAGMDGSDLSRQLGNSAGGLPYTVLIGPDGRVRKTYLGRLKLAQLRSDLADLKS